MNFIEELSWRGMLFDMTPGADEMLENGSCTGYIGFDPTAPSLTIGNYVQIMLLKLWQLSGNKPVILMGGATGRIGDPSGKSEERQLKTFDELDSNLAFQMKQMEALLDFDGPNGARIVNNYDFYKNMNVLDFLRDVGKTLTVNYMTSKDSVKKRLETGLSFTEFSYQLLQAYDFQCLYQNDDCTFQMGGSDQWGNITSGTEFIRRNANGKAYAITTPLLTKADGTKFGKSEAGNIWLDPSLTTPYAFYQFWINATDADIEKYVKYFSLMPRQEIQTYIDNISTQPNVLQKALAEELTVRIHGKDAFESAELVSDLLFNPKAGPAQVQAMKAEDFKTISTEIPSYTLEDIADLKLLDMLSDKTGILSSKSEARRAVKNNAIAINKVKISDEDLGIVSEYFMHGKYMLLENGKKNKCLITLR